MVTESTVLIKLSLKNCMAYWFYAIVQNYITTINNSFQGTYWWSKQAQCEYSILEISWQTSICTHKYKRLTTQKRNYIKINSTQVNSIKALYISWCRATNWQTNTIGFYIDYNEENSPVIVAFAHSQWVAIHILEMWCCSKNYINELIRLHSAEKFYKENFW